jgi:heme-degrading monooxygenase HmoA
MYARVAQFRVRPGQLDAMLEATKSVRPELLKQKGFRVLLVLRRDTPPALGTKTATPPFDKSTEQAPQVTTISVWDSYEDLRASEKNLFLYQALARMMIYSQGFPVIREAEVLSGVFGSDLTTSGDDD